jgi:hypothetical protein
MLPRHPSNIDVESCWRQCWLWHCRGDLATMRCRCHVMLVTMLPEVRVVSMSSKLLCLQRQPPGTYPCSSHDSFFLQLGSEQELCFPSWFDKASVYRALKPSPFSSPIAPSPASSPPWCHARLHRRAHDSKPVLHQPLPHYCWCPCHPYVIFSLASFLGLGTAGKLHAPPCWIGSAPFVCSAVCAGCRMEFCHWSSEPHTIMPFPTLSRPSAPSTERHRGPPLGATQSRSLRSPSGTTATSASSSTDPRCSPTLAADPTTFSPSPHCQFFSTCARHHGQ